MQWTGIFLSIPVVMMGYYLIHRWMLRWHIVGIDRLSVHAALAIKLMACFALQALYTYYYTDRSTADIYRFFDDGVILKDIAFEAPFDFLRIFFGFYPEEAFRLEYFDRMNAWIKPYETGFYNDNHTMIRLNALLAFVSLGYYEVHGVIATMMSFSGMLLMIRSFKVSITKALMALTLLPGILFWTSGLLKETLVVFGLGLCLYAYFRHGPVSKRSILIGCAGVLVLLSVKPYFLAALIPAALLRYTFKNKREQPAWQKSILLWSSWALLMFSGYLIAMGLGIDLLASISQKQHDFLNHAQVINAGSLVMMPTLEPTFTSFFLQLPDAISQCFLRPMPWALNGAAGLLMLLENIMIVGLCFYVLILGKRKSMSLLNAGFLLQIIIPVVILIGYTTPVLGAVMRYRAPVIILLILFLFQYLRNDRFLSN